MSLRAIPRRLGLALVLAFSFAAGPAAAQSLDPIGLRGDASGSWYDPAQSGHGLLIEILDRGQAVVTWYAFDNAGAPMWLIGVATIEGQRLRAPMSRVAGGRFPPLFNTADTQISAWGELVLEFSDCDTGTLHWTPTATGFSAGPE